MKHLPVIFFGSLVIGSMLAISVQTESGTLICINGLSGKPICFDPFPPPPPPPPPLIPCHPVPVDPSKVTE